MRTFDLQLDGKTQPVLWRSEQGLPPPDRLAVVDDRLSADSALSRLRRGEKLLYRGDHRNARQLLAALGRRLDKPGRSLPDPSLRSRFLQGRQAQGRRARLLGSVLVELDSRYQLRQSHAPDVAQACREAWGEPPDLPTVVSLRELLGVMGASQWRARGIPVRALGASVHPHYGVFGPVRQEYVDLVAQVPLPAGTTTAFDVGTGTGVLALLLAKRGVATVVATDVDPRAVACARENVERFGLASRIRVEQADLLPQGQADLILFNPPWLPIAPSTPLEAALYDEGGKILARFLSRASDHLKPGGTVWLVISDLAERLGLREAGSLSSEWTAAGLRLLAQHSIQSTHARASDEDDPLHEARKAERTTLYVLTAAISR